MRARETVLAFCVIAVSLSGCLQPFDEYHEFDLDDPYANPGVFKGEYHLGASGSTPLRTGMMNATEPEIVRLKSNLPAYGEADGVAGDRADVDIVMAIWRPWNQTGPLPVIVDAGPYYEVGEHCVTPGQDPCQTGYEDDTIDYPGQTTPFNLNAFLPHGYIVVQLAVRGTGTAGGCMDLMGPSEVHDLDQAITWLGEQEWSNGHIAMVGASYDGSTPWEVAGTGNPYLKTIVPTSGLPDIYGLMFRNGSAEWRGPGIYSDLYWPYGFDDEFPQAPPEWPSNVPWVVGPNGWGQANGRTFDQDMQNLACAEAYEGRTMSQYSTHAGDRGGQLSEFWKERDHRQAVLDNYEGSIFLIHGLQDWNVDPHAAIPFNQELRDAGIEMKEWYGQWAHQYPDSSCAPTAPEWVVLPCRLDYAEVLLRWFDHYLKGNETLELGPSIQVQDSTGYWRNADSYPPRDADWLTFSLSSDGHIVEDGAKDEAVRLMPPGNAGPSDVLRFVTEPLEHELHLSGMPQIKLPFEVEGQGGQIAAWLFDEDPRGMVRAPFAGVNPVSREWVPYGTPVVGHAEMNLRYYAGGDEPQVLQPGTRYEAQIQFEPLEVRIPEGHRLSLWIFQYHFEDRQDVTTKAPVTVFLGDGAKLRLPTLDLDPRTVFPVPGAHFLNNSYVPEMYVQYPPLSTGSGAPVAAPQADTRAASAKQECLVCL